MKDQSKKNNSSKKSRLLLFLSKIKNLAKLKTDVWSIKSNSLCTENIKTLLLGENLDKNYFGDLIYNGNYDERYLGKMWIAKSLFLLLMQRKNYNLLIAVNKMDICNIFKTRKNFLLPTWIDCEFDMSATNEFRSLSKSTLKNNIRKMEKGAYHYSITRSSEDFHFFYHCLYFPYISNRYNHQSVIDSFDKMKKYFKNGEVLLVKNGKKTISGALIQYSLNGIPKLKRFGILDGDFSYVKRGALTAAYYYSIAYLKKKKIKKISFGASRPFFFDGVLRNKLIWGGKLVSQASRAILLHPLSNLNCIKTFLSNNPFIYEEGDKLILAAVYDGTSEKTEILKKTEDKLINYGISGIKRLSI